MISEALLEMHYQRAIVEYFSDQFGAKFLSLIKPTPNRERFLGFDQGWVKHSVTEVEFLKDLENHASGKKGKQGVLQIGFFLQFKLGARLKRKSKHAPSHYDMPYYRFKVDTKSKEDDELSQHELLVNLASANGASVSYACPMVFDDVDVYARPNVDEINFVDVLSAPYYVRNSTHYITFQNETDESPYWNSTPTDSINCKIDDWSKKSIVKGEEAILNSYKLLKEAFNDLDGLDRYQRFYDKYVEPQKSDELGIKYHKMMKTKMPTEHFKVSFPRLKGLADGGDQVERPSQLLPAKEEERYVPPMTVVKFEY